MKRKQTKLDRLSRELSKDSVRICVPKAFVPILTLFFHHVSDAMAGDDRPDHGLAKMRQGRDTFKYPFYALYGALQRCEKRLSPSEYKKAHQRFWEYRETIRKDEERFHQKMSRAWATRQKRA